MTVEEAIALVEQLLKRGRLTRTQEIVFRYAWEGKTYLEIAREVKYDYGHIKDVGSQLWRSLSQALNEKVTKNNLHRVLKGATQQQNGVNISPRLNLQPLSDRTDWGEAIDVSRFYGRTTELETLSQWIVSDRTRLITLLGMGGIGKTSLAVKVAENNQDAFEYVFWRSLRNAPPIQNILLDLIKFLSNQQEVNLPDTDEAQLALLMKYLSSSRCLLILDNVETILVSGVNAGNYREGYESYGQLFRYIAQISHQLEFRLSHAK